MTTNVASTYLTYANVQMAAEALLHAFAHTTQGGLIEALEFGNNRSSKFTTTEAENFASEWEVVAHQPNTSTGFSGTVFRYKGESDSERGLVQGQLVISFRSTEFADDNVRDSKATNELEIKEYGWAFGQIADMEAWYASLRSQGLIDRPVTVTGYSLGGHLATAFNLLRQEQGQGSQIAATYTFNGAGVGDLKLPGTLSFVVQQFERQRENVSGDEIQFSDTRTMDQGDDTLAGGVDNDMLFGGAGTDAYTYTFAAAWGADIIQDSDGLGVIQVETLGPINGSGAKKVAEGVWQTEDKRPGLGFDGARRRGRGPSCRTHGAATVPFAAGLLRAARRAA